MPVPSFLLRHRWLHVSVLRQHLSWFDSHENQLQLRRNAPYQLHRLDDRLRSSQLPALLQDIISKRQRAWGRLVQLLAGGAAIHVQRLELSVLVHSQLLRIMIEMFRSWFRSV